MKIAQSEITVTNVNDGSNGQPGRNGTNGAPGTKGNDGKGVKDVKSYFLLSNTPTGITRTSSGWSTTAKPPTVSQRYVWCYTETTFTDNTKAYSEAYVSGVYGETGAKGADGRIMYTWVRYATDKNGSSISDDPTGRRFLGVATNRPTQTPSNNPSDYVWSQMYMTPTLGGMNMVRNAWIVNHGLTAYAFANDTWQGEFVANNFSGWGKGVRFNTREISIYPGETLCISAEIWIDQDNFKWYPDINNTFAGITNNRNDNDEESLRTSSGNVPLGEHVLQRNVWNRVYATYTAKKTGYTELIDDGTQLLVSPPNGWSGTANVRIRRIMVEKADLPGGYALNIQDLQEYLDDKASKSDFQDAQRRNEERLVAMEAAARDLKKLEPEWFRAYKANLDQLNNDKRDFSNAVKQIINEDYEGSQVQRINAIINNSFKDRSIVQDNNGVSIGKGNNRILVNERGISIFSGNSEPSMVITSSNLEIPNGAFIKTYRIGHYQEEAYGTDSANKHMNVIRYIP